MEENNNEQEVIDEIKLDDEKDNEEQDDLSGKRKIYTEQGDPEIDSLITTITKNEFNLQALKQSEKRGGYTCHTN